MMNTKTEMKMENYNIIWKDKYVNMQFFNNHFIFQYIESWRESLNSDYIHHFTPKQLKE